MESILEKLMPGDLNYTLIRTMTDASKLDSITETPTSRQRIINDVATCIECANYNVMIRGEHGIGKSFVLKNIFRVTAEKLNIYPILYFNARNECGIESLYHVISLVAGELDCGRDSAILARYDSTQEEKHKCLRKVLKKFKALFIDDADANGFKIWKFLSNFIHTCALSTKLIGSKLISANEKDIDDSLVIFDIQCLSFDELSLWYESWERPDKLLPKETLQQEIPSSQGNPSILQLILTMQNVTKQHEGTFATNDSFTTILQRVMNALPEAELYILSQLALCRKPLRMAERGKSIELKNAIDFGLVELSTYDNCTFYWLKNCVKRGLAAINSDQRVDKTEKFRASFSASELWRRLLHKELQELLKGARQRDWPYIPESWQFTDIVSKKSMHNLGDLLNLHNASMGVTGMREIDVIQECLYHSLFEGDYEDAAAIAFLIDRYMFWKGNARSLLAIVDYIQRQCPDAPIAPQLLTRQVRVLKNYGDLQGASRMLDDLIANESRAGSWVYKNYDEYLIVKAASIELKGNLLHSLGLWQKAASCFMTSTSLFRGFEKRDKKGIAAGLAALADTLQFMPDKEFESFAEEFQLNSEHRLLEAIRCVTEAANYCVYTPLFYAKNKRRAGEFSLAYTDVLHDESKKNQCLENALHEVTESLKCHTSISRLESSEQFYEFVCCIFRISQICHLRFAAKNKASQIFENLSKLLFYYYCTLSPNIKHNDKSAALINESMAILSLPKIPRVDEMKVDDENLPSQEIAIAKDADPANIAKLEEIIEKSTSTGLSAVNIKGQNKTQHNSFDFNLRNQLTIEDEYDEKIDIQNSATLHETLDLSGEDTSVVTCSKKLSPDGVEQISIENFTKKVLSNARTIESVENNAAVFKDQSLRTKDTCASCEIGSISTEFEVLNALCSDVISEKDFRSASTKSTASHTWNEQVFAQSPCELQLFYKTKDGETVEERGKRMKKTVVTLETVGNFHQNIEATQDESFTVHEALVWRYDPIIKQWNTNQTLAYVGEKKDFGSKEGACRDVFDFKHLNQDDPYGRYLGKRYKLDKYQDNPMSIAQYQQDIICQNTARFYGTLFNQKLYELSGEAVGQIQFLPTVLVELKNIKNDPERYFNVEPFMFGNFEKITNNMDHVVKEDVSGMDKPGQTWVSLPDRSPDSYY